MVDNLFDNLDAEQLQAAQCSGHCLVRAGAGAGKTRVLCARYLYLVTVHKIPIRHIVALTFTRKAAREMYERIYIALRAAAHNNNELREQVAEFDDAVITTLHGYCLNLIDNYCDYLQFQQRPRISPEEYREMVDHISYTLIQRHADSDVLARIIVDKGMRAILMDVIRHLAYDELSIAYSINTEEMIAKQHAFLSAQLADANEKVLDAYLRLCSSELRLKVIESVRAINEEDLKYTGGAITQSGREALDKCAALRAYFGNCKQDTAAAKEALYALRDSAATMLAIIDYMSHAAEHRALLDILADYQQRLRRAKLRYGLLTFRDVEESAVMALQQYEHAQKYHRSRCQALLIDEFQDNNALQKNLIYLLAGGSPSLEEGSALYAPVTFPRHASLFVVGDDKQSIYGFRGAESDVFNSMAHDFQHAGAQCVELKHNYRTHPALLKITDYILRTLMAQSGQNAYSADPVRSFWSMPQEAATHTLPPYVSLWHIDGNAIKEVRDEIVSLTEYDEWDLPLNGDESEAYYIVRHIHDLVTGQKPIIITNGRLRHAEYDDFAILVRKNSHISIFAKFLRQAGAPFSRVTAGATQRSAFMYDTYHILQLALTPSDRYSYAASLRSPWIRCSDSAIGKIISTDCPPFSQSAIIDALGVADRNRYERGASLYHALVRCRASGAPLDLVDMLWFQFGYRYIYARDHADRYLLSSYDTVRAIAIRHTNTRLFVDEIYGLLYGGVRSASTNSDRGYAHTARSGVQLMTIHQAKGLEFPVVIIANSATTTSHERATLFWHNKKYGYSVAYPHKNMIFALTDEQRASMNVAELNRILYVSMTRAQSMLIISANLRERKGAEHNTLWGMVQKTCEYIRAHDSPAIQFAQYADGMAHGAHDMALYERILQPIQKKDATFTHQERAKHVHPHRELLEQVGHRDVIAYPEQKYEISVTALNAYYCSTRESNEDIYTLPELPCDAFLKQYNLSSQFGTVCHTVLMRILQSRLSVNKTAEYIHEHAPLLLAPFAGYYTRHDYDNIVRSLIQICDLFARSDTLNNMRTGNHDIYFERPFLHKRSFNSVEYIISGVIDLMIIAHDDTNRPAAIYLIDYKSDAVCRSWEYAMQLCCYKGAIEEIYTQPITPYLYFLRSGEWVPINEDENLLRHLNDERFYKQAIGYSQRLPDD